MNLTTMIHELESTLPADHVQPGGPARVDVCRFNLGEPVVSVRPTDTEQVRAVVELARRSKTAVVPHGYCSGYWRALDFNEAIALDIGGLDATRWEDEIIVCGAGVGVRQLDILLRKRGLHLPLHPDAFGETSIGSLVASACTSGIGMGEGAISRHITGLTVVTGDGMIMRTGTGWGLRDTSPFMADGTPDLTSAFIGSEGTFGVITEVALRPLPAPWRVNVQVELPGTAPVGEALVRLGQQLGAVGIFDTFRAAREIEGDADPTFNVDVWVISRWSPDESIDRAKGVAHRLFKAFGKRATVTPESEAAREGQSPDYDARWQGPEGSLAFMTEHFHLAGMDVNAPYSLGPQLIAIANEVTAEQRARGAFQVRTALYMGPEFLNLGLHSAFSPDPDTVEWTRGHVDRWLARLSELEVIPYRFGRIWPTGTASRLTPGRAEVHRKLKAMLDPDGIMNPGHSLHTAQG